MDPNVPESVVGTPHRGCVNDMVCLGRGGGDRPGGRVWTSLWKGGPPWRGKQVTDSPT